MEEGLSQPLKTQFKPQTDRTPRDATYRVNSFSCEGRTPFNLHGDWLSQWDLQAAGDGFSAVISTILGDDFVYFMVIRGIYKK